MKALVCGTGPLLAVLNSRDKYHAAAVELFDNFDGALIVPSLVVTEVCYLAQTQVGPQAEAAGFPPDVADASAIATAERLHITQLASIDHRHMRAVRPAHCAAFELLPA